MTSRRTFLPALLCTWLGLGAVAAEPASPLIGDTEQVCTLAPENTDVRGLALDDVSADAPRLLALDRSGKVYAYRIGDGPKSGSEPLELLRVHELPAAGPGRRPSMKDPRGLAFTVENGHSILYTLSWEKADEVVSRLWRFDLDNGEAADADLALYQFRIGDREPFGVAADQGQLLICFDASGYADSDLRVQRGIVRLEWTAPHSNLPRFVRHMPDAGTASSHGLAVMGMDQALYLWATVGDDHVYCADAATGRGLFWFACPRSAGADSTCAGLAFGQGSLWVCENGPGPGPDRVHRVNVTRNLDAYREGPRVPRHLVMSIETRPEKGVGNAGRVYHNYSRPYAYEQLHNQGCWLDTEKITDLSGVPNAEIKRFHYDPAGDPAGRQHMINVEYADAPARQYASRYELDVWTNPCRKYVYPHRASRGHDALRGTDYLADDPELYNLSDTKTYEAFMARVAAHIKTRYGAPADMENPYWAARNVVEYIQDNYYYPIPPRQRPATVDYDRKHYDANPANLKIELSDHPYDKTQIIACSGTSVVVSGAMRHLGIPARWLGTGTQRDPKTWDTNGNGLLDADETATCTNGHRYNQIWLGDSYGWICFDATPSRPPFSDYDPAPPLQSQWRLMNRCAAGHMADRRIVFNVASTMVRPLYRDFEYDEKLAANNECGGDQRYNLLGRFEKPELWRLPSHRIELKNLCFIADVKASGPKPKTVVTWRLEGCWDRDPAATLTIVLQLPGSRAIHPFKSITLARGIRPDARSALVDLSEYRGTRCRLVIRKEGDEETGGCSELLDLSGTASQAALAP